MSDSIDSIVQTVRTSAKYRTVTEAFVRSITAEMLRRYRTEKEALKATKNKLHQVCGAYFEHTPNYSAWLEALRAADSPESRREVVRRILSNHASSRERLPILDQFYQAIFAALPPIRTVMDVACGLNPLYAAWLPPLENYYAYDLYEDLAWFLGESFTVCGVKGTAEARDVIGSPPTIRADLALVLKTLPCLEQSDSEASGALLNALNVAYLAVSFPSRSLSGRGGKGMAENYEARFMALIEARGYTRLEKIAFENELVFVVSLVNKQALETT